MCDAIVAKCLTGRPKTVEKAQAIFMLWVELEAVEAFLVRNFLYFLVCFHFSDHSGSKYSTFCFLVNLCMYCKIELAVLFGVWKFL